MSAPAPPPVRVRRLAPGDEPLLRALALEEPAFDVDGRGTPQRPLSLDQAAAHLADPAVLHWVAEQGDLVVGDLLCHVLRLDDGDVRELLLYEIGVRSTHRRRGIGRRLLATMDTWMAEHEIAEVWVLADNDGAESFYRACGFERPVPQPTYLTRRRPDGA